MTALTTPVPDDTDIGELIDGKLFGRNLLNDAAGADAMGLVGASPAANTLLGRLKTIADGITALAGYVDGLEPLATSLNGFVDGLETLVGTTNTSLTSIGGYVDGLEALATALNGYVDGLETLQGTANTTLTTIAGYVDGLEALISATNTALAAATPAGENHIGKIGGEGDILDVTLSLDTSAYASGDVLADTQVITNAMRVNGGTGVLQSIKIGDEDDQGVALDLIFLGSNASLGTENSAPSITDVNEREILGIVSVGADDYKDLGGSKVATITGIGLMLKSAGGSRDIYVAAVAGGSGTYTGSGIRLRVGIIQN